jgi:hypothetical protein
MADPCHICYVTKQSPHPYFLKIRPCNVHVDRHRWEILDNEGLLQRKVGLAGRLGTLGCGTSLSKIRMEAHPVAEFRIGERPQIENDLVHQP